MRKLIDELSNQADLVLIDCPPILAAVDAGFLASLADGVLLVLRAGQTHNKAARDAVQSLQRVGARLIGVALNAVPTSRGGYYGYYKYYPSENGKEPKLLRGWERSRIAWRQWLPNKEQMRLFAEKLIRIRG
jgi:Mrp family chromosome partitioning ATPase